MRLAGLERLVNRPYYVYRPAQVLRRLQTAFDPGRRDQIVLPWGLRIRFDPLELLGRTLARNGVYEVAVSEFLWRLADPGEVAVDVGANIGYTASILATRVGREGRVYALEPHPELFQLLGRNVQGWRDGVVVDCIEAAASDRDGDCLLTIPNGFTENRGLARIAEEGPGFQVRGVTLDRLVRDAEVGVLKIDAEGHEGRVLDGARRLLSEHLIRDVIFEEHDGYPSRSSELLESAGYTVYGVEQGVRGPRAATPKASRTSVHGAAQNYVATTDPERLRARIRPSGWRVLRPGATHAAGAPAGAAA